MARRKIGYLNNPSGEGTAAYQPARPIPRNATIGLLSPSEPVGGGRIDRLEKNLQRLRTVGFDFVEAEHARASSAYTAGSALERAADFHELANRADVDCLLSTWGGKQCNELLELIDFELLGAARKPILSFSDGCVLLNAVTSQSGLATFHGPNVAGKLDESDYWDLRAVQDITLGPGADVFGLAAYSSANSATWRSGDATGRLFGGNLNTFVLGLVGTQFLDVKEPVIFFWESMGDRPQIIHQQLTCLVNCGWFDRVSGMVVGDLLIDPLDAGSEWKARDAREAVLTALHAFKFPILKCSTFGHRALLNPVVPIGPRCALDADSRTAELVDPVLQ